MGQRRLQQAVLLVVGLLVGAREVAVGLQWSALWLVRRWEARVGAWVLVEAPPGLWAREVGGLPEAVLLQLLSYLPTLLLP